MFTEKQNGLEWGDWEPAQFDENGEPVEFFTHLEDPAMRKAQALFSDEVLANRVDRLTENMPEVVADDLRRRWDEVEGDGYTHGELRCAFDMVANPDDWRAPVDSVVDARFVELVKAAVEFFTATSATTRPEHGREARRSPVPNPVRVRAAGYRAGPAGP